MSVDKKEFLKWKDEIKKLNSEVFIDKNLEISRLERKITQCKNELDELKYDEKVVKSNYTKENVSNDINRMERRIEQLEFKLWKLTKEEL